LHGFCIVFVLVLQVLRANPLNASISIGQGICARVVACDAATSQATLQYWVSGSQQCGDPTSELAVATPSDAGGVVTDSGPLSRCSVYDASDGFASVAFALQVTSCADPHATTRGGCFSAAATVWRQGSGVTAVSDLVRGDRVLSTTAAGTVAFSKVFRVTHHDSAAIAEFVRVRTSSGQVLELTPSHMLHAGV
jgi:hypothetical protein